MMEHETHVLDDYLAGLISELQKVFDEIGLARPRDTRRRSWP